MILIDNFKNVLTNKYATFDGRASRSEYWWFVLATFIISIVLGIIDGFVFGQKLDILQTLFSLAVLVPCIAIAVRRLHDIGKSGWWILIGLIPLIGWIIALIFAVTDSNPGTNAYGPNPKGVNTTGGASAAPSAAAPAQPVSVPDPLIHGNIASAEPQNPTTPTTPPASF
jgi:uncharacterized membrane protein YhaH (DUF805 family)